MLRQFTSASSKRILCRFINKSGTQTNPSIVRHLSTTPTPPPTGDVQAPKPPIAITKDMAFGIQHATELYMNHGVGNQKLVDIGKEAGVDITTLVSRWQRMMEAYLGTQVHVLAGLGYAPNENGLHLYNQHVAMLMNNSDPETQENLRIGTRDMWRNVLATAFDISTDEIAQSELPVVEARDMMYRVSQKMQSAEILEIVAQKSGKTPPTGNAAMDMAMKHQVVQDTLVHYVYLGGEPSLVEELGFEKGEKGYVLMQCIMAEHQNDPLVGQYVGTAMMKILESAGIDLNEIEQAAKGMKN